MTPAELIAAARAVTGEFPLSQPDLTAGSVGAAILTQSGRLFTGICIDLTSGIGFCAEHAAAAEMLKARETRIAMVAAVGCDGTVMPPCGRCREMMYQIDRANVTALVVLGPAETVSLDSLLPRRWF